MHQPPGPIFRRAGCPFPMKGRGGITECKYLNPCTSQRDSCHRSETQAKSIVLHQQPTWSSFNVYYQTVTCSSTHIWKNTQTGTISSYLHASLPASQIRRTDGKSPRVYSGDDECDVLDAQSQRGSTETMEVNRLAVLENPHMIEPHPFMMRRSLSERRSQWPTALVVHTCLGCKTYASQMGFLIPF